MSETTQFSAERQIETLQALDFKEIADGIYAKDDLVLTIDSDGNLSSLDNYEDLFSTFEGIVISRRESQSREDGVLALSIIGDNSTNFSRARYRSLDSSLSGPIGEEDELYSQLQATANPSKLTVTPFLSRQN